jgi:uncharacterized RDD family membrane protein YckC
VSGYIAPDGAYTAEYPGLKRRAAAALIDWLLAFVVFLIASIVAGIFEAIGFTSYSAGDLRGVPGGVLLVFSQLLAAVPVIAYFTLYWATGSTLGMRALDVEVVEPDTGRPPSRRRALARGCLAFVLATALNNVYLVVASEPLNGYTSFQRDLIAVSFVLVGLTVAAKAWMLIDERRQTLLDKLFGLLYLEEMVFTQAASGPWTTSARL